MVDSKRYDPTITRFQKHTQSFVSGKTKKGHLNEDGGDREESDVIKEEGVLVRVNSKNIYGNTWEVKVGNKTYMCSYGDNIIYLPPYTEKGIYYVPKKECKVEISIDKKSKIYTITRINDTNKQPITMTNDGITLQSEGNASLKVDNEKVSVKGDIQLDTSKDEDLPDTISVKNLYKKIQVIESKLSDKNDS